MPSTNPTPVAMTDDLACDSSSCDSSLRKVCMPTVVFTSCRICERFSILYDLSFSASMISSSCPVILLSTVSDDDELT
ncbi:unknown [Alistipes finegoldii CAG:68]|nr:unknown [Alistipes finegoldii CAG:68]